MLHVCAMMMMMWMHDRAGRGGEREPNEMKWNRIDKDFCWLADVPFYYARLARIDKARGMGVQAAQSIIMSAQWSDKLNKKFAINWCKLISFYIDIFLLNLCFVCVECNCVCNGNSIIAREITHITYTPRCMHLVGQVNLSRWAELSWLAL